MLHRLMRVLDWITFIYALGSLLVFTYMVFAVYIFNWYVPQLLFNDFVMGYDLEDIILLMPIIYSVWLILQYIIRDKVRILPWK